jgi:hypothetical protein
MAVTCNLKALLVALVLSCLALGCGGDVTPGVNKDKDRPKSTESPAEKK